MEPDLHIDSKLSRQGLACGLGSPNDGLVDIGRSVNNAVFVFKGVNFESSFIHDISFPTVSFCFLLLSLEGPASSSPTGVSCVPVWELFFPGAAVRES